MKYNFTNQVAVITGGTRGIGRDIALLLSSLGCNLALIYFSDHESAEETVAKILSGNPDVKVKAYQCHLGDRGSLKDFWERFDQDFHQLNFFISNAATGVHRPITTVSSNSIKKVFSVNIDAFVELANESIKRMPDIKARPGEKGRVITLSSLGAERVIKDYGTVGSSKAALEALTRQYAAECGPVGINCNCIRAGLVDTGVLNYIQGREGIISDTIEKTPNKRLVTGEDVAQLAAFLLSPFSSMINGQTITIDGGFSLPA